MSKIIYITKEDIKNGIPGKSENCPVALALKRDIPNVANVQVSGPCFVIKTKRNRILRLFIHNYVSRVYQSPVTVSKFIRRLDAGSPNIEPFSFELPKPLQQVR